MKRNHVLLLITKKWFEVGKKNRAYAMKKESLIFRLVRTLQLYYGPHANEVP